MQNDTGELLKSMAPFLNSLLIQEDSKMFYCRFSDGVFWDDEVPRQAEGWCAEYSWVMRGIIRHRTAMLLNLGDSRFAGLFDAAKELFPHWPGFSQERCTATQEFQQFYENSKRRDRTDSDEIDLF